LLIIWHYSMRSLKIKSPFYAGFRDRDGYFWPFTVKVECKKNDAKLNYWKPNDEVDFVISDKEIIPVEAKYKNRISENDKNNLKNFMRKFKRDKAFLITKNLYGQEKVGKSSLYFIPAEIFLLSITNK